MQTNVQTEALAYLAVEEGGLVDNAKDPGGVTNYGISLRWLRSQGDLVGDIDGDGDVDADDIRAMTRQQADALYLKFFWLPAYEHLPAPVVLRLFSHHVNAGPKSAALIVQRAARAHGASIVEDGVIGPNTVVVVNTIGPQIINALRSERAGFYRGLVIHNPDFRTFEKGWLNRAYR